MSKEKAPSNSVSGTWTRRDSGRSTESGRFIEVRASGSEKHTEKHASPRSERVIKKSSVAHRDALKRLVDR